MLSVEDKVILHRVSNAKHDAGCHVIAYQRCHMLATGCLRWQGSRDRILATMTYSLLQLDRNMDMLMLPDWSTIHVQN